MAPKGKGHQSWMLLAHGLKQLFGLYALQNVKQKQEEGKNARCRTRVATKGKVPVTGAFRERHSREGCLAW